MPKKIMKQILYIFLIIIPTVGYSQNKINELLSKAEQKHNNLPQLIEIYSQILKLDSNNYEAILGQGDAYYRRWKILGRIDKNYLDSALIQMNKACVSAEADYRSFLYRGELFYEFEKFQHAFNDFTKALSMNDQLFRIRWKRSKIFMLREEYQKAIADINIAFELAKDDLSIHYWLYQMRAGCYAELSNFTECKKDIDSAFKLNPTDNETILLLADYYALTGNLKKALKKYNLILSRNPYFAIAYLKRGNVYFKLEDINKAKKDWDLAKKYGFQINEKSKNIRLGSSGYTVN